MAATGRVLILITLLFVILSGLLTLSLSIKTEDHVTVSTSAPKTKAVIKGKVTAQTVRMGSNADIGVE